MGKKPESTPHKDYINLTQNLKNPESTPHNDCVNLTIKIKLRRTWIDFLWRQNQNSINLSLFPLILSHNQSKSSTLWSETSRTDWEADIFNIFNVQDENSNISYQWQIELLTGVLLVS